MRDGNIDYVELSHAGTTKNSCVFFHKITFRPRPSLQLNLVQGNPPKTKAFADVITDRNKRLTLKLKKLEFCLHRTVLGKELELNKYQLTAYLRRLNI